MSHHEWCAMFNINADEQGISTLLSAADLPPPPRLSETEKVDGFHIGMDRLTVRACILSTRVPRSARPTLIALAPTVGRMLMTSHPLRACASSPSPRTTSRPRRAPPMAVRVLVAGRRA